VTLGAIHGWGEAVQTSLAAAFAILLSGIPKIIGFLIILVVGWIIAAIAARLVLALLHAIHFNDMAQRAGVAGFVHDMGVQTDSSGVLADITKWFIRLIFLVAAFDALGLPTVSHLLNSLLLWLPDLVVALVVLVVGGLLANALSRVVRGATAESGFGNPDLLGTMAKFAVWGFAFIVALNQIGIASTLVNILFIGFVAALALAFGLAFGLGGRETAGQIVQDWYRQSQQVAAAAPQTVPPPGQQAAPPPGTTGYRAAGQGGNVMTETISPSSRPQPPNEGGTRQ